MTRAYGCRTLPALAAGSGIDREAREIQASIPKNRACRTAGLSQRELQAGPPLLRIKPDSHAVAINLDLGNEIFAIDVVRDQHFDPAAHEGGSEKPRKLPSRSKRAPRPLGSR